MRDGGRKLTMSSTRDKRQKDGGPRDGGLRDGGLRDVVLELEVPTSKGTVRMR